MRHSRFVPALLALAFCTAAAGAADLSKIERTIAREPEYAGPPKYCLLVFGPEAKTRMWLVISGTTCYLDPKGTGEMTRAVEYKPQDWHHIDLGPVPDADGTTRHGRLSVARASTSGSTVALEFKLGDKFRQYVGWDSQDRLILGDRPGNAPIIHIGGPLTFDWYRKPPQLIAGRNCRFFTRLGTAGVGQGSFAAVSTCSVPKEARLVAQIRFPGKTAADAPILEDYDIGDD